MKLSEKQIDAVISLPASKRYGHFIKQVADLGEVWGLYQNGWAISADDSDARSLPIWSAVEYAKLLRLNEWESYSPKPIKLKMFLKEMLPDLELNSISLAVMYVPKDLGIVVSPERLANDIEMELENY